MDLRYVALNRVLLQHGEGMAFPGLLLGTTCALLTRRGWRSRPTDAYSRGRLLGAYYLRWPMLAYGFAGLLTMLAAALS